MILCQWCHRNHIFIKGKQWKDGASLMAQWLRIRLPMQGTHVWALVQEDPTCRRAAKPVHLNYWACALEPASHNYWAHAPRAHALQQEKPLQWEACSPQLQKAHVQQQRPNTAKKKKKGWHLNLSIELIMLSEK